MYMYSALFCRISSAPVFTFTSTSHDVGDGVTNMYIVILCTNFFFVVHSCSNCGKISNLVYGLVG